MESYTCQAEEIHYLLLCKIFDPNPKEVVLVDLVEGNFKYPVLLVFEPISNLFAFENENCCFAVEWFSGLFIVDRDLLLEWAILFSLINNLY